MADALDELKRQVSAVGSAPIVVSAALILIVALVWGLVHWSYSAILSSKNAQITSLEHRVAQYRDSVRGASPEDARRRIDALEGELGTLRIRLSPRRLTPAQQQAIADRSRRPAGTPTRSLVVLIEENCSDCAVFTRDITAALRVADNWNVTNKTVSDPGERSSSGLAIRVPEPGRPPADAVVLQQALRSAGLAFRMLQGDPGSGVELLIAERTNQ